MTKKPDDKKLADLRETRRKLDRRYNPHIDTPQEPHKARAEADAAASQNQRTNMGAHPLFVVSPTRRDKQGHVETDWGYVVGYVGITGLVLLCALLGFWAG